MILGLRTALYPAPDLPRARAWYSAALGVEPYFDQPFYVGFAIGGFELGLVPDGTPGTHGALPMWGVANADHAIAALLGIGGTLHEAVHDVGDGIRVGSVLDPFGNVFGVIENPHFDAGAVR